MKINRKLVTAITELGIALCVLAVVISKIKKGSMPETTDSLLILILISLYITKKN